ncbi:hypothetical protein, partial [Argonema antarcticum]|uniref:hypothetical protein n=1 Tax=Argonema antarcticum TaxID=2942763 RepID=UPI00201185EC
WLIFGKVKLHFTLCDRNLVYMLEMSINVGCFQQRMLFVNHVDVLRASWQRKRVAVKYPKPKRVSF